MRKQAPEEIQVKAVLRKRNQLTLPTEAADLLGLHEGDVIVIEVRRNIATLRPVRRSYAGALRGVYGNGEDYLDTERASWE